MKRFSNIICILTIVVCSLAAATDAAQFNQAHTKLMKTLENLHPTGSAEVLIAAEKEQYKPEEAFDLRFRVEEDGYIALMHISTEGDIVFFAPSYWIPARVEGGKVYSIKEFQIPISIAPPGGIETINLFYSKTPFNLFDADINEDREFYQIRHDEVEKLAALTKKLEELDKYEWSGNGTVVHIINPDKVTRDLPGVLVPPISTTGTTGKDVLFPPIETTGSAGHSEGPVDPTE